MNSTSLSTFSDSKKHYEILDGLRGVAAVMVVFFHVLETFSLGDHTKQIINHGYLAVDFFFVLSGFVIGYAYDDRWHKMSLKDFFKRRLIRLHPMIIIGMLVGAIMFFFQKSEVFPPIQDTSIWKLLVVMLIGFTLLPVPKSLEIRGWGEMHPLDGPAWTLFFEYIGNILYALVFRKLPNKILTVLVIIAGAALIHMAVTSPNGDLIGGWSTDPAQLRIGFTRLLYPFMAGLLLSRIVKPGSIKRAFTWCTVLLIVVFAIPRIGGHDHFWMNGLYDSLMVVILFPLIVYLGASGKITNKFAHKTNRFLGQISYPLYIVHYPFIYTFTAWVFNNREFLAEGSSAATIQLAIAVVLVLVSSISVAYLSSRFFDIPVRQWLTKRFMKKSA